VSGYLADTSDTAVVGEQVRRSRWSRPHLAV